MYDQNSRSTYNPSVKAGLETTFFGKVMFFFALAVFASFAGVYTVNHFFFQYFYETPALMWGAFIAELILIFTARMWIQKAPINRLLFAVFAFLSGVTAAPLIGIVAASPGGVDVLTKALLATGFMFTATALIGWTTKIDLSGMRGFLMSGLIGMIVVGIIGIFTPWGNTMEMIYSGFGVLLFSGFVAYDFQKLKHYPEDRYIDAALALYLDIFNLFLYILRFIDGGRR